MTGHFIPNHNYSLSQLCTMFLRWVFGIRPAPFVCIDLLTWAGLGYDPQADMKCCNCGWEFRSGETLANRCPRCTSQATMNTGYWGMDREAWPVKIYSEANK